MRIIRRPLAPRETDHELIWLVVSLGGLALAASWFALALPWPTCVFHHLTGHPCPTCGATRSALAFFHGQFSEAWKWNPLALVGYATLSVYDAYAFGVLALRKPRLRISGLTDREKLIWRTAVLALVALNWSYLWWANRA
jgi:hypothetical protein